MTRRRGIQGGQKGWWEKEEMDEELKGIVEVERVG